VTKGEDLQGGSSFPSDVVVFDETDKFIDNFDFDYKKDGDKILLTGMIS
jgi:ribulose 1,5-bisphosphate synthetase/thiazole synthase